MSYRSLTGSVELGTATGARATFGLAALAYSDRRPDASWLMWALQSRGGRVGVAVLVAAEVVGDKLPMTPSRLGPPGLGSRLAVALLGGAVLARRGGRHPLVGVLLGGSGAVAGTFGGARYRRAVAERGWPDLPAALVEDGVALGLARTARALDRR